MKEVVDNLDVEVVGEMATLMVDLSEAVAISKKGNKKVVTTDGWVPIHDYGDGTQASLTMTIVRSKKKER